MSFLQVNAPPQTLDDANRALESLLVKQLLLSSGAFKAAGVAGGELRRDLFVDALADAVVQAGGLGLTETLTLSMAPPAPSPADPPLATPVAGARVTSTFGLREDPFHGETRRHDGVDLAAPEGTPIRAVKAGVVISAGERGGYGNTVTVDHGDGLTTLYAHAKDLLVQKGQRVEAGQAIATVGSTGRSTGNHLHFEVREGGRPVDPSRALKAYTQRVDDPGAGSPALEAAP